MQAQTRTSEPKACHPTSPAVRDFSALARSYAEDVCAGKITACRYTERACRRFLDDLERDDWRYEFDPDLAGRACRFMEQLPHIKGPKANAGELLVLEPWEAFIVCNIFGWVDRDTRFRRFRRAIVIVGRGNGKSFLASGITLYMFIADHETGAEIYTAATKKEQARIIWDVSQKMLRHNKRRLAAKFDVDVRELSLFRENSKYVPLANDYGTLDGLITHCAVIDELHAVDAGLWGVIETSMQKRSQPLLLSISTAGWDTESIGFKKQEYCKQVLDGNVKDERWFTVIYEAESDNFSDRNEWLKANPNLGISVQEDELVDSALRAQVDPSARMEFLTKQLNRWLFSREPWMPMDAWKKCADSSLKLEQFKDRKANIGLDLAFVDDLCAKAYVFTDRDAQGRPTYTCFWKCYLPKPAIETRRDIYVPWEQAGWLTKVDGPVVDFTDVRDDLVEDVKALPGSEVDYDQAQAPALVQDLEAEGITAVRISQSTECQNPILQEMFRAVQEGRLRHDGNPVAAWCMSNVTVKRDHGGRIRLSKREKVKKIDAISALYDAMARAMLVEPPDEGWLSTPGHGFIEL